MKGKKSLGKAIEDAWLTKSFYICIFLAIISSVSHYYGFIENFRVMATNVINFASIIIGVIGVFLTLIITLQESPVFVRLKTLFPGMQKTLYITLRNQIFFGLIVVLLSLAVNVAPTFSNKMISFMGVAIWFYFFWLMSIGAFYAVWLIADLVLRNFEIPVKKSRE